MERIRAGIIGGGMMCDVHTAALRRLGFVDVSAVAKRDQDSADETASKLLIPRAYADYRRLIEDKDIDVVHVLTPNRTHFQMSKDALEAGKHVVCEKPLAMTYEEGVELLSVARKAKKCHEVNHNMRYYPMVKQAKEYIRAGDVGNIRLVNASYLQDWLFYEHDYNWRVLSGEGGKSRAIADIGTHIMDMVQDVTGLRIESVCADLTTFLPIRKKPKAEVPTYLPTQPAAGDSEEIVIDTEDHGSLLVNFEGGAKGIFMISQISAGRKNHIRFEIFGSKSSLAWNGEDPNNLWIGRRDAANATMIKDPTIMMPRAASYALTACGLSEGYLDTFVNILGDFYGWIRERNPMDEERVPFPTFKTGCQELAIVDAVFRSNDSKQWTKVPEVK